MPLLLTSCSLIMIQVANNYTHYNAANLLKIGKHLRGVEYH